MDYVYAAVNQQVPIDFVGAPRGIPWHSHYGWNIGGLLSREQRLKEAETEIHMLYMRLQLTELELKMAEQNLFNMKRKFACMNLLINDPPLAITFPPTSDEIFKDGILEQGSASTKMAGTVVVGTSKEI